MKYTMRRCLQNRGVKVQINLNSRENLCREETPCILCKKPIREHYKLPEYYFWANPELLAPGIGVLFLNNSGHPIKSGSPFYDGGEAFYVICKKPKKIRKLLSDDFKPSLKEGFVVPINFWDDDYLVGEEELDFARCMSEIKANDLFPEGILVFWENNFVHHYGRINGGLYFNLKGESYVSHPFGGDVPRYSLSEEQIAFLKTLKYSDFKFSPIN